MIIHIQSNYPISYINCDNSGENKLLSEEIDPLILPITFEYNPIDTTQQNVVVERK